MFCMLDLPLHISRLSLLVWTRNLGTGSTVSDTLSSRRNQAKRKVPES